MQTQQTSSISTCILNTFAGSLLDRVNIPLVTGRYAGIDACIGPYVGLGSVPINERPRH